MKSITGSITKYYSKTWLQQRQIQGILTYYGVQLHSRSEHLLIMKSVHCSQLPIQISVMIINQEQFSVLKGSFCICFVVCIIIIIHLFQS